MKKIQKTLLLCGVFIMTFFSSCDENNASEAPCGCDNKDILKVVDNVNGRIGILSKQYPNTWVIVSEEGVIGEDSPIFDGPDIVVVCSFPDSLKIQDQKVVFSGYLKSSCEDYETWTSRVYAGQLTAVSLTENEVEK